MRVGKRQPLGHSRGGLTALVVLVRVGVEHEHQTRITSACNGRGTMDGGVLCGKTPLEYTDVSSMHLLNILRLHTICKDKHKKAARSASGGTAFFVTLAERFSSLLPLQRYRHQRQGLRHRHQQPEPPRHLPAAWQDALFRPHQPHRRLPRVLRPFR